jgi:hypothetical protein
MANHSVNEATMSPPVKEMRLSVILIAILLEVLGHDLLSLGFLVDLPYLTHHYSSYNTPTTGPGRVGLTSHVNNTWRTQGLTLTIWEFSEDTRPHQVNILPSGNGSLRSKIISKFSCLRGTRADQYGMWDGVRRIGTVMLGIIRDKIHNAVMAGQTSTFSYIMGHPGFMAL